MAKQIAMPDTVHMNARICPRPSISRTDKSEHRAYSAAIRCDRPGARLKDLIRVGGDHVNARQLPSGLDGEVNCDTVEGLGLAVEEQFAVWEWHLACLSFKRGNDCVALGKEGRVIFGRATQLS